MVGTNPVSPQPVRYRYSILTKKAIASLNCVKTGRACLRGRVVRRAAATGWAPQQLPEVSVRAAILRLRCRGCGRTHAVIPSWSLPDTSVGTAEVECYLMARERDAVAEQHGSDTLPRIPPAA